MPAPSPYVARAVAVVLLLGLSAGQLLGVQAGFHEEPYVGVAHLGGVIGCLVGAAVLLGSGAPGAWWFALVTAAAHLAGYVVSRTVGLPLFHDEVGAWLAPAGLATAFAAGVLSALSVWVLASGERDEPAEVAIRNRYATFRRV